MELKVTVFWLAITILLYVLTKAAYHFSDKRLIWKFYKRESWIGGAYLIWLQFGGTAVGAYLIIQLARWWFNAQ